MPVNLKSENDEINLFEILAALWAHKIIIVLLTTLSVFISGYYLVSKTKNLPPAQYSKLNNKITQRSMYLESWEHLHLLQVLGVIARQAQPHFLKE